ncbi:acyltransferase family protein [Pontibaca methylaminivorans]|uniref:acyltransferase family protein n=1 Tax=Pontibaca methylaminivorans TaxID=515897 RepID=UPI002FD94318
MRYRPEIDGLRAIAVAGVVFYHFGATGLPGGFVGVDVFFVISGFLIGGILWSELGSQGRIALGRFYLRRIRRLAPAFFAMAAASTVAAWFILLPYEFREFGKELIAASTWLSNILYYRGAGYFDIDAGNRVLLHSWSLAVEEQFYIALPVFLVLLTALGGGRRLIAILLAAIWALSLLACVIMTPEHPAASFYLFPYRAWELLSGVLLAIMLPAGGFGRRLSGLLSWGGLALVAGSILLVRSSGFPGWQAVLPVAGTVMIIAGTANARGQSNPAARFLSLRPMVFVGLISYSLYLWHWPVLVLSHYWRDGYSGPVESGLWLLLCLVLASASWRWVEQPIRHGQVFRYRLPPRILVGGTALASAATIAAGTSFYASSGWASRFSGPAQTYITASADFFQDWSRCSHATSGPLSGIETCAIGPEGDPEVLIWGDSHLRALMQGLGAAADENARPGAIIWHAGCPPLFGIDKHETAATPEQDRACSRANARIREAVAEMPNIQRILLVGRWTYYADGDGIGLDAHNLVTLAPAAGTDLPPAPQEALFAAALQMTVQELHRHIPEVFLLRQVPELPRFDSPTLARRLAHGRISAPEALELARISRVDLHERNAAADAAIGTLVETGSLRLIDPWGRLCSEARQEGHCTGIEEGQALYFDNNHLTNHGALQLRGLFGQFFTIPEGERRT